MSQELRNNYLFNQLIDDERRTRVLSKLLAKHYELAKAVKEVGKAGEITLKIKISKSDIDEEAIEFDYVITSKVPEPKAKTSIGYVDEKSRSVIKTDPRQLEMLAEKEEERLAAEERARQLSEQGITRIGRGESVTA